MGLSAFTRYLFVLIVLLLVGAQPARAAFPVRVRARADSPAVEKPPVFNRRQRFYNQQVDAAQKFVAPAFADSVAVKKHKHGKLKKFFDRKAEQAYRIQHPDHDLKSGIYGKLAFYCGLLSVVSLLCAFIVTAQWLALLIAILYTVGFLGSIVFGLIGITRRRKRGKAILGLAIGLFQVFLFVAIASFASSVAAAAPAIFESIAFLLLLGRG